jgi:hypothetical protein
MKRTEKQKNKDNGILVVKDSVVKREIPICPVCHRPEKSNTRQEDLVACGMCTAVKTINYQKALDKREDSQLPERKRKIFEPREIVCNYAGCDNKLMQKSPVQKYCQSCKKKLAIEKAKEKMKKKRSG